MQKQAVLAQPRARLFDNAALFHLILPLIVEQFLTIAVGMVDSVMVSSVGEAAVSAVSLVDTVNVLIVNLFTALATGGAVVAGQYLGREDPESANQAGNQLLLFTGAAAVLVMLAVYAGRNLLLDVVFGHLEADVRGYCSTYLLIVSASIPFIALYNSGAALFRVMGNSQVSMIISAIMNTVNIGGNALLIYRMRMGVAGAAIPTLVSRVLAAVLILLFLRRPNQEIRLRLPFDFHFDREMIMRILRLGVPSGLENSMFQLGKIVLLSLVATFGTASIAANAVGNSVTSFQSLAGMAMNMAMVAVISRCVGARDEEQIHYYIRKLMIICYVVTIAANALLFLLLPFILSVYNLSPETMEMARQVLLLHGFFCCLIWPLSFTLPNALRAANDVRFSMIVSVASMWLFRVVCGVVFATTLGLGMFGTWVAMIVDWAVRSVFFLHRIRSGGWKQSAFRL